MNWTCSSRTACRPLTGSYSPGSTRSPASASAVRRLCALSERVIVYAHCGLGPVDRDKFSAFKARLIGETAIATLDAGCLNTPEFRAQAIEQGALKLPAAALAAGEKDFAAAQAVDACAVAGPVATVATGAGEGGTRTRVVNARGVPRQGESPSTGEPLTGERVELAEVVSDLGGAGLAVRPVIRHRG